MDAFLGLRYFSSVTGPVPFEMAILVHDAIPLLTFNVHIAIPESVLTPSWFNNYQNTFKSKGVEPGKALKLVNDIVETCETVYVTSPIVTRVLTEIAEKNGFKRKVGAVDVEGIQSVVCGKSTSFKDIKANILADINFGVKVKSIYGALQDAHILAKYISDSKK